MIDTVVDPDLELRGRGGGFFFANLAGFSSFYDVFSLSKRRGDRPRDINAVAAISRVPKFMSEQ